MASNNYQPVLQQLGTNWYGQVWLTMACLAYTDDEYDNQSQVTNDLQNALTWLNENQPFPPPPGASSPVAGSWNLDFPPLLSSDNVNMVYGASFQANNEPVFAIIGLRGTDTTEADVLDIIGVLDQLAEDLDVGHMVNWQNIVDGYSSGSVPTPQMYETANVPAGVPAIAKGTWNALSTVIGLTQNNGQGILQYAASILEQKIPLIVTGHSLGGCLTSVVAPLICQLNPGSAGLVYVHPFAPPSAGNQAWNQVFQAQCPNSQIWWNTVDVAPNAFQNLPPSKKPQASLSNILSFWSGVPIDGLEALAVGKYINEAGPYYYHLANTMPAANVQQLNGGCLLPVGANGKSSCDQSWLNQLMLQHFPPMYQSLIYNQLGPALQRNNGGNPIPNYTWQTGTSPTCSWPHGYFPAWHPSLAKKNREVA